MGNQQSLKIIYNEKYTNIEILQSIGILIKQNKYELNHDSRKYIKSLYKTFYYPTDSVGRLEEIAFHYNGLKKVMINIIESYNKFHSTNIDSKEYVKEAFINLEPTLDYSY